MVLSEKGDEVKTTTAVGRAGDPWESGLARAISWPVVMLPAEEDAMLQTEPDRQLEDVFKEGLAARENGLALRDNPYAAGSQERREWDAGFCATTEPENEDDLSLDPNENAERRTSE